MRGRRLARAGFADRLPCLTVVAGCTEANPRGAPKGNKNAWKHGRYSEVAKAERSFVKQLLKDGRKLLSKRET